MTKLKFRGIDKKRGDRRKFNYFGFHLMGFIQGAIDIVDKSAEPIVMRYPAQ